MGAFLVVDEVAQTDWIPQLVDFARNLPFVGPERVAALENAYYATQDSWSKFVYDRTHGAVVVVEEAGTSSGAGQASSISTPTRASSLTPTQVSTSIASPGRPRGTAGVSGTPTPKPSDTPPPALTSAPPSPIEPLILSDPQFGEGVWTTANLPSGGQPSTPLRRTFYRPDPDRPYARVDLVWMDLNQTQLALVPGTKEPRPQDGIAGQGQIPIAVQVGGRLLAAWNGGFLTIHGAYGMMVNRRVILPPRDGFAALAQYEDGSVRLGVWGQDIVMSDDLMSFRQNGPILVDGGVVNQNALLSWGRSVSGETRIWRSGIGLTQDGNLIFGAGNALSAQTLGEALEHAGAVEAMQLDVNEWHVFFFGYSVSPTGLLAQKLNPSMPGSLQTYLIPHDRDFMYLTLK